MSTKEQDDVDAAAGADAPRGGSGAMFDGIAERYDMLNRVLSLGIDQSWRKKTVAALRLDGDSVQGPKRVLDIATGTADLAIMIARKHPDTVVVGLDPSRNMRAVGQRKIDGEGLSERIELVEGEAEKLPFQNATFAGVSIAFGIRNVVDRPAALREMARVTVPHGRIAILELSEPREGLWARLARFHIHEVVPSLGGMLSGEEAYRYLKRSIVTFPPAHEFAAMMADAGLDVLEVVPLTFGVSHLYVATPKVPSSLSSRGGA